MWTSAILLLLVEITSANDAGLERRKRLTTGCCDYNVMMKTPSIVWESDVTVWNEGDYGCYNNGINRHRGCLYTIAYPYGKQRKELSIVRTNAPANFQEKFSCAALNKTHIECNTGGDYWNAFKTFVEVRRHWMNSFTCPTATFNPPTPYKCLHYYSQHGDPQCPRVNLPDNFFTDTYATACLYYHDGVDWHFTPPDGKCEKDPPVVLLNHIDRYGEDKCTEDPSGVGHICFIKAMFPPDHLKYRISMAEATLSCCIDKIATIQSRFVNHWEPRCSRFQLVDKKTLCGIKFVVADEIVKATEHLIITGQTIAETTSFKAPLCNKTDSGFTCVYPGVPAKKMPKFSFRPMYVQIRKQLGLNPCLNVTNVLRTECVNMRRQSDFVNRQVCLYQRDLHDRVVEDFCHRGDKEFYYVTEKCDNSQPKADTTQLYKQTERKYSGCFTDMANSKLICACDPLECNKPLMDQRAQLCLGRWLDSKVGCGSQPH